MNEDQQIQPARSSVTLKRGAKGTYSWEIKLYRDEGTNNWDNFLGELRAIDLGLRREYRTED